MRFLRLNITSYKYSTHTFYCTCYVKSPLHLQVMLKRQLEDQRRELDSRVASMHKQIEALHLEASKPLNYELIIRLDILSSDPKAVS